MFPVVYAMKTRELTTLRFVLPTQLELIKAHAEKSGTTKVTVMRYMPHLTHR